MKELYSIKFTFICFVCHTASPLYKTLGQGAIQMAKCSHTTAHRKSRSGTTHTGKFSVSFVIGLPEELMKHGAVYRCEITISRND